MSYSLVLQIDKNSLYFGPGRVSDAAGFAGCTEFSSGASGSFTVDDGGVADVGNVE